MGFVARKSFKLAPGVRVTVSKSGISASAGVPGARITCNTSGRTTKTVGIPGSGVYYRTSSTSRGPSSRSSVPRPTPAPPPSQVKPGLFDPKWEKELYKALTTGRRDQLAAIGSKYPEAHPVVTAIDGLYAMSAGDTERALTLCRAAFPATTGGGIAEQPFVKKYLRGSTVTVQIADGVSATLPIGRDAIGLALAELEQAAGNIDAAIDAVEQLDPSAVAAVSLSELYLEAGRHDDVVDVTNGLSNTDDPTALLLAYRGAALRELGHHTAAREAFKEALKSRSRDAAIRHFALVERAKTNFADGKQAAARKDLERVLAEDASFPGVRDLLEQWLPPATS